MSDKIIYFKRIRFYDYSFEKIFRLISKGGVLVAPAASALTEITKNKKYYNSLINSDIAIFDSGLFCIFLKIFKGISVNKLSGYLFLKKLISIKKIKTKRILLIDPSIEDSKSNLELMKNYNFKYVESYVAPIYRKNIQDKKLIKKAKIIKPNYIIINIGGGVQEQLGIYLKKNLKKKIAIICTGAAIAFLTKRQAPINDFVDKMYLGWLWRIIFNPKKFFLRTLKSFFLIKLFF